MDFDFGTSEPPKENTNNQNETSQPPQQNNDGFFNMDFQTNPSESQPQTNLDDMLNMNFQPIEDEAKTIPIYRMPYRVNFQYISTIKRSHIRYCQRR